jgi:hypothetical protein
VTKTGSKAAADVRVGTELAQRKRAELLDLLRPCFARVEPWAQAGKYVGALAGDLRRCNGWSIAEHLGDATPDRTQRLLNHAVWDTFAAMGVVRRFAVAGLGEAARRSGRRAGLVIGALDETGQAKKGMATAGVKRQHMGCADGVANGINTVHLSYVRERTGHALIGARQWIPREHIDDPVACEVMGLAPELAFRTKGQLAIDIATDALADDIELDFVAGGEVYGNCPELREFCEACGQAYVLRVPSNFRLTLASGAVLTCAEAVSTLLGSKRCWEVRSAGAGSFIGSATTGPRLPQTMNPRISRYHGDQDNHRSSNGAGPPARLKTRGRASPSPPPPDRNPAPSTNPPSEPPASLASPPVTAGSSTTNPLNRTDIDRFAAVTSPCNAARRRHGAAWRVSG